MWITFNNPPRHPLISFPCEIFPPVTLQPSCFTLPDPNYTHVNRPVHGILPPLLLTVTLNNIRPLSTRYPSSLFVMMPRSHPRHHAPVEPFSAIFSVKWHAYRYWPRFVFSGSIICTILTKILFSSRFLTRSHRVCLVFERLLQVAVPWLLPQCLSHRLTNLTLPLRVVIVRHLCWPIRNISTTSILPHVANWITSRQCNYCYLSGLEDIALLCTRSGVTPPLQKYNSNHSNAIDWYLNGARGYYGHG